MKMYIANLLPLSLMTSARFLTGDSIPDVAMGALAPFVAFQMWYTGRPLVLRMGEDARLRFKVEDLASELEEARDQALKKRFEAETANASKTAFLANMSHELRTPLNAILGFSEIIAQECFGPVGSQRYRDYAGDIHASGAHLLSLINDLLDVAKIEAGRMDIAPHPLDPGRVFDVALKLGRIEIHVTKIAGRVPRGLVVEVFRRRVAAFAARCHGLCTDGLAEFDYGDKTIAARAVNSFRPVVGSGAK